MIENKTAYLLEVYCVPELVRLESTDHTGWETAVCGGRYVSFE